jgi:hypothetical protein
MQAPNLFKSRKFWIMIVDVSLSTVTYFVAHYVSAEAGQNIMWLIGAWQPVIFAVINGIATEDAAAIEAGLRGSN